MNKDYLDDEFEKEESDDDVVVVDRRTGFYERKSECIRQDGGWVHQDTWDENPKTTWYRTNDNKEEE